MEMRSPIRFFVPGIPRPGGSKKSFHHAKTGKIITMDMGGQKTKDWRSAVASFALEAMVGKKPLEGPLKLRVMLVMPRPKNHYGTGKNAGKLRGGISLWHAIAPDTTKLLRSTEDACKGLLWRDDCQVAEQHAEKIYTLTFLKTEHPGAWIEVTQLES